MDNYELVCAIEEGICGHIAMASVCQYVVEDINERFNQTFDTVHDMYEFLRESNSDVFECEACGWYCDDLASLDCSCGIDFMCTDCGSEHMHDVHPDVAEMD